jgi:hypothetical protein
MLIIRPGIFADIPERIVSTSTVAASGYRGALRLSRAGSESEVWEFDCDEYTSRLVSGWKSFDQAGLSGWLVRVDRQYSISRNGSILTYGGKRKWLGLR